MDDDALNLGLPVWDPRVCLVAPVQLGGSRGGGGQGHNGFILFH